MTTLAPDIVVAFIPLVGVGVIVAGVAMLRHPEAVAKFFRRAAEPLWGERISAKVYKARGARAAGIGYIAFGILTIVTCVAVLIARHL